MPEPVLLFFKRGVLSLLHNDVPSRFDDNQVDKLNASK